MLSSELILFKSTFDLYKYPNRVNGEIKTNVSNYHVNWSEL